MKRACVYQIKEPNKMPSYWKAQWKVVLVIVMTGLLYNGSMELGPILQGKIIDLLVVRAEPEAVKTWILIFIVTIGAIQTSRCLKRYYVRVFANRTSASMRRIVYKNLMNKDVCQLKDEDTGDLMTKAISDVGECVEGMRKFTTELFDTGILMIAYFITLSCYDVSLTLAASAFIPASMFLAERMKKIIYGYTRRYREQLSKVSDLTLDNIENELLYRMHGVEGFKSQIYDQELADLQEKAIRANLLENSMQPVYRMIGLSGLILVVYYGGHMVLQDVWSIGDFSAYMTIFSAFAVKASRAAKLFNSVQKAQVSWQRLRPYLNAVKGHQPAPPSEEDTLICLKVKNLSFRVIKAADFVVRTGEIVGITGPIASGKSTAGAVLQGFYPYEGSITINNRELRSLKAEQVGRLLTYMGHESQLLSDTIYNNITLGEDGDISQVLQDVCFEEDLAAMPEGIHTLVGASGIRLSGGQQSRLALARALYNGGRILVLDDPFAAVDVRTEGRIMKNLREHYKDRGILLISHRISSFKAMERVILIKDGETVCGTHEQLMETSKVYKEIFTLQEEGCNVQN